MNKATLRKVYLEKRLTLTPQETALRNKRIAEVFFEHVALEEITYLHCYLPIPKFNEPDTWPIIRGIQKDHPNIDLVIPKTDPKTFALSHYVYESEHQLKRNRWGIDEPVHGREIAAHQMDLILVPLVIADKKGMRIGYGKGFYDRFLAECKPDVRTIGLSLAPLLDAIDYAEETDIPLDACITPGGITFIH